LLKLLSKKRCKITNLMCILHNNFRDFFLYLYPIYFSPKICLYLPCILENYHA